MDQIETLLKALKEIKNTSKSSIPNNFNTWVCIAAKDWEGAGFKDEEEAKEWIKENPYANL